MSDEEKYNDIEQLMYRELSPDRYCYIHNYIIDLRTQLQQKENIINKVREYIEKHIRIDDEYPDYMEMLLEEYNELLEILERKNNDK